MNQSLYTIIPSNRTVAVAVSGGGDSMALLHYLNAHAEEGGYRVTALNVEHGIRGAASERDSAFVRDYCEKNQIPLLFYAVRAREWAEKEKVGLEEAARTLRYACFRDALDGGACDLIALAHHAGDQAETVLMNLLRGAGLNGAGGMAPVNGAFVRPFLHVPKGELTEYLEENAIPFVTDETNLSDTYTRNALRNRVMPLLSELYPAGERNLVRFAARCREENAYLDALAEKALAYEAGAYLIAETTDRTLFDRAVLLALKKLGVSADYGAVQTENVEALRKAENGASCDLGRGIRAVREYGRIAIDRQREVVLPVIPFALGEFAFGAGTLRVERVERAAVSFGDGSLYADADKIPEGAVFRAREAGDMFCPFGGGTKKLKEFLIDRKIPKRLRGALPVLASGKTVYFIADTEISDLIKVDKSTRNVVKLSYILHEGEGECIGISKKY